MEIKDTQNYLAIKTMLSTITLLSNDFNDSLDNDSFEIINFIGDVFNLNSNDINTYSKLIKDDLTIISKLEDVKAFKENYGQTSDIDNMLYLKSEVLLDINNIYEEYRKSNFNESYFDYYNFRPYFSLIRFNELENASRKGNVEINRTVAILLTIGIGREKDIESAIYRFKQCAYWGDQVSIFFLAYLYNKLNDEKNYNLYFELSKYYELIFEGKTILPKEIANQVNIKVIEEYSLIASTILDIKKVYKLNDINYSFIEIMLMDSISYAQKMNYINNYKLEKWRNASNPSNKSSVSLILKAKEVRSDE